VPPTLTRLNPPNDVSTGAADVDGLIDSAFGIAAHYKQALEGNSGWQLGRSVFGSDMPHHHSRKPYSLGGAIKDAAEHDGVLTRGSLEAECSQELAIRHNRTPAGFLVPFDAPMQSSFDRRAVTQTTGAGAIATVIPGDMFIDALRAKLVVAALGGQIRNFSSKRGYITIPSKSSASQISWVAEGAAPASQSNMVVPGLRMTPRTISTFVDVSRRMLSEATPDFLAEVEDDVVTGFGVGIDAAALNGLGVGGVPLGLFQYSTLSNWPIAANIGNGGVPVWADLVAVEAVVGELQGDSPADARLGWCTSPAARSKFRRVPEISATGFKPAWRVENGRETLLGWPAASTTNCPGNLTQGTGTNLTTLAFGDWRNLIVNLFSPPDVIVNPYLQSVNGNVRVSVFQDSDVLLMRGGSFCLMPGIITT
jgi:HK97 family phage major capsid protein